eukprot:5693732-Amphidinium_carterae.1
MSQSRRPVGVGAEEFEQTVQSLCGADSCVSLASGLGGASSDDDDFIVVSELSRPASRSSSTTVLPSVGPVLPIASSGCVPASAPAHQSSSAPLRCPVFTGLPCGPTYIVWRLPGCSWDPAGVHVGDHAWLGILGSIPGQQYRSGQDRLRALVNSRDPSETRSSRLSRAVALYQDEARRHKVSSAVTVWLWVSPSRALQWQRLV